MVSPVNHISIRLKFLLIAGLFISRILLPVCYAEGPDDVRVLIVQDASSLRLKISGPYELIDSLNNKTLSRGSNLNTTVTACQDGIALGDSKVKTYKLFIKSNSPNNVIINGGVFKGGIQIIKNNMRLSAINYIELEDYVKGISVRETSHYWPIDSLKAEVIAFRTFAIYKMQENAGKDFDLTSDVYSQVYGGRAAERYRINKAVDETKGLVITYKGKIFPSFYHATCGGHTDDAFLFWKINILPLKGVACNFCQGSPHSKWHNVLTQKEIRDALIKGGFKIDAVNDIVILGRDKSGRITELKITSGKKDIVISSKDFRNTIGPNIIKSTNFQVRGVDRDIVFEGLGWGHGVGLCQWGAYFMAKGGYNYKQILEYYYPQSEISPMAK